MNFKFHPEALGEYEDAARFYGECQPGLELRFIECVERTIRQIVQTPERWRVFEEDVRRCLTKVFPYALLYTIETDCILIIAVMHCHREPGYWLRRIGEGEPYAAEQKVPDCDPDAGDELPPKHGRRTKGPS